MVKLTSVPGIGEHNQYALDIIIDGHENHCIGLGFRIKDSVFDLGF